MNWKEIGLALSKKLAALKKELVLCDCPKKSSEIRDEIRGVKWDLECHRGDGCEL